MPGSHSIRTLPKSKRTASTAPAVSVMTAPRGRGVVTAAPRGGTTFIARGHLRVRANSALSSSAPSPEPTARCQISAFTSRPGRCRPRVRASSRIAPTSLSQSAQHTPGRKSPATMRAPCRAASPPAMLAPSASDRRSGSTPPCRASAMASATASMVRAAMRRSAARPMAGTDGARVHHEFGKPLQHGARPVDRRIRTARRDDRGLSIRHSKGASTNASRTHGKRRQCAGHPTSRQDRSTTTV